MSRRWRSPLFEVLTVAVSWGMAQPAIPAETPAGTISNGNFDNRYINVWAVRINGTEIEPFARVLQIEGGGPLLTRNVFAAARLKLPTGKAVHVGHEDFFPVDGIDGGTASFDLASQTLTITVPASGFLTQTVDLSPNPGHARSTSETGAFLNYDFNYTHNALGNQFSVLTETVFFSPLGALSNRYVARNTNMLGNAASYRLDTQFVREIPESMAELVVGDSLSAGSSIGRQLHFGGVQWRRRFAIRPDYQILPLPVLSGVASAPSLVDIYVDNILRARQPVDAGPFALNNLPLLSGQGNIRLVVNDVLGRQQVISQPYVLSPLLLKTGTTDFSYEAGFERLGFGTPWSRYRQAFVAGTHRTGMETGTLEWHGEAAAAKQVVGMSYAAPLRLHLFSTGGSISRSARGSGQFGYLQLERVTSAYSYSTRVQKANRRFNQLGVADDGFEPTLQWQAQASKTLGTRASLSAGLLERRVPQQPDLRVLNAAFNSTLPHKGFVSIGISKLLSLDNAWSINAGMFFSIGADRFTQINMFRQGKSQSATFDLQQVAPPERGWGYRFRKTMLDNQSTDIGVNYNTDTGQYAASASRQGGQQTVQIQARAGVATLGGHVLSSRWIENSFAMLEVPIEAPVDIYANNRKVGQTRKGVGMISQLVPHVANRVYLDDMTLPVEVSLDLEQKSVVPPSRAGLLLKFDAVVDEGAVIELVDAKNLALPPGTSVRYGSQENTLTTEVGLRGLVYLPRAIFPLQLQAFPDHQSCRVSIDKPVNMLPLSRIGPVVCQAQVP
ncbi:MAG: fimbria/pilus outer membrane usher protein [Pseudomonadota bacterium]